MQTKNKMHKISIILTKKFNRTEMTRRCRTDAAIITLITVTIVDGNVIADWRNSATQ